MVAGPSDSADAGSSPLRELILYHPMLKEKTCRVRRTDLLPGDRETIQHLPKTTLSGAYPWEGVSG